MPAGPGAHNGDRRATVTTPSELAAESQALPCHARPGPTECTSFWHWVRASPIMLLLAGDILRRTARRLPRKTAVICGERRLEYAALDAAANRFANALRSRGIGKGDAVAVMSPNYPEYAIAFYGAARLGAVVANLSTRSTAAEVARLLAWTGAKAIVAEASLAPLVKEARATCPALAHIIAFGAGAGAADGVETLEGFTAGASQAEPRAALNEEDPLALTFTGGTTGVPKGVLVSHRARGLSALTTLVELGLEERDIAAIATPLFHAAGLFAWLHPAVMCGATTVFVPRWDPEDFITAAERHRVTAALLVPTQINDLIEHKAFAPTKLRSLRKINHAGMPMPVGLIGRVRELMPWAELTDHYGTSESGPIAVRRHHHLPDKAASVGRPAFNIEVEIRGPDGRALPPGAVGEVATLGEHLMIGYYKDPRATAAAYPSCDGWFWTGDVGYFDEDGFLVLVDRSKDVVVLGGENIFPLEIENVLYQHPGVLECAVVGIPDERLGEVPAAHVVLRPGTSLSQDELLVFCLSRLARHKRPRLVKFVDVLPKTALGKIEKHKIREPYWRGRARKI